jgi:hypothetical protein
VHHLLAPSPKSRTYSDPCARSIALLGCNRLPDQLAHRRVGGCAVLCPSAAREARTRPLPAGFRERMMKLDPLHGKQNREKTTPDDARPARPLSSTGSGACRVKGRIRSVASLWRVWATSTQLIKRSSHASDTWTAQGRPTRRAADVPSCRSELAGGRRDPAVWAVASRGRGARRRRGSAAETCGGAGLGGSRFRASAARLARFGSGHV